MTTDVRSVGRHVSRWTLAVIVFVLTLESSVRIEDWLRWGTPMFSVHSVEVLFASDSLGRHLRPGARYQKWTINDQGFRGPALTRKPVGNVIRVAVLGSSETFGQTEAEGNEFPRVLERMLNERAATDRGFRGIRFEVINAGVPGMTVARMTDYWERWVAGFEPDAVVAYPAPTFYLGVEDPGEAASVRGGEPRAVEDSPRLVPKTREAINRFLPERVEAVIKQLLIDRQAAAYGDDWVWTEVPESRLASYADDVEELVTSVSEMGVGLVLATHATLIERPLDRDDQAALVGWRKFFPRATGNVILDFEAQANEVLVQIASESNIPVARTDRAVSGRREYFSDHAHFTDAGASVFTESLIVAVLAAVRQESREDRSGGPNP